MLHVSDKDLERASKHKSIAGFVAVVVASHIKNWRAARAENSEPSPTTRVARFWRY